MQVLIWRVSREKDLEICVSEKWQEIQQLAIKQDFLFINNDGI